MRRPTDLDTLSDRIGECLLRDQPRLRKRLRGLNRARQGGRPAGGAVEELRKAIERSLGIVEQRRASVPPLNYPPELPVVERRAELTEAIRDNQIVVVCGETGSGKTTQLPKICLEVGRGALGSIAHTQPRRIAARSVSARIAEELGVELGGLVGYKVRFGDKSSPRSLIKVVTDGVLLAETQGDRNLERYDTIIIDEAHERSLNIDFLLGYLHRLARKRSDLKIIVTSATIDPGRFSEHFGGAPIIEVSGRTYPVETRFDPPENPDLDDLDNLATSVVDAVDEIVRTGPGDVLVFMPGEREIRAAAKALRDHDFHGHEHPEVLPLYARLSTKEQQRIFESHRGRRIIISTNVAETSLTVPGIRYVVDPGTARINRYSARTRTQRLLVEPISRASADQRRGRCGRIAPGVCVRLYSEDDYAERPEFTDPEILRTNLAGVILQMKSLRLGKVENFPFIDRPDRRLVRDAYETLHELGAIDEQDELTSIGEDLARLPIDPRIGRMLLGAVPEGALAETLIIAAALSVQDPRDRPIEKRDEADAAHEQFANEDSDFLSFLNIWRADSEEMERRSRRGVDKWRRERFLSPARMREWRDVHRQLRELLREMGVKPSREPASYDALHRALLTGLLHSVGHRGDGPEYEGPRGVRFFVFPGSALFSKSPRWAMAAELVRTTRLYARCVAKVQPEWIERVGAHLVRRDYSDPHWRRDSLDVGAYEKVSLWGLTLVPRRIVRYGPIAPDLSREMFIHNALVEEDLPTRPKFLQHNRKLRRDIERLEARTRRNDLLADPERRFEFYDKRIPRRVYDGERFENWRRRAEQGQPRLLFMEREDMLAPGAENVSTEGLPTAARAGEATLRIDYVAEVGAEEDGVSMTIPIEALGRVDPARCDWMPEALVHEKATELIRTLPKDYRRMFVPAPDAAKRAVEAIADRSRPMPEALAGALAQMAGVPVTSDLFRPEDLPAHLRVRFRIVDSSGKELASGRDLAALQRNLSGASRESLNDLVSPRFRQSNLTEWTLDRLPERIEVRRSGAVIAAHPALVDEGAAAGVRVFPTLPDAQRAMRRGLRRLLAIQLARELHRKPEDLPGFDRLRLFASAITDPDQLVRDADALIAETAYLPPDIDPWQVRDASDFERLLTAGWNRLADAERETVRLLEQILEARHQVELAMPGTPPATAEATLEDVRTQLAWLMPPGFLLSAPREWLPHYPRYLRAIQARLHKLSRGGVARDRERMEQLHPFWAQCLARLSQLGPDEGVPPALEQFRWMLEEMRVSLFAQEMGTATPVSFKRLDALARSLPAP